MKTIVVDAMGADLGMSAIVQGAAQISQEEEINIVLVGHMDKLQKELDAVEHNRNRISIVHASEEIGMNDDPRVSRPNSSLYQAAQLVAEGKGHALVSAGNTGAVVVCASKTFSRVSGVDKVALAAVYPTRKTHGPKNDPFALLLDVGATLHVEAKDLVCFSVMGSIYAQLISENASPRVALLSNGEEAKKGAPEVVKAHSLLQQQNVIHFVGNVEGVDIPEGSVDVIVCEGFLGNVVLKLIEGVGEIAASWIRSTERKDDGGSFETERSLYQHVLRFAQLTDWRQYGGAPILGLDQIVIKAHGRSTAHAIRNAIKLAKRAVERDMIHHIRRAMDGIQL